MCGKVPSFGKTSIKCWFSVNHSDQYFPVERLSLTVKLRLCSGV